MTQIGICSNTSERVECCHCSLLIHSCIIIVINSLAARWGYEDIVLLLLEFGASCEARNKEKELPLDCTQNSAIQSVFKDFISKTKDSELHKQENNRKQVCNTILINSGFNPMLAWGLKYK